MAIKSEELQSVRTEIGIEAQPRFVRHVVYLNDDRDNEFFETWNIPDFPVSANDAFHTVAPGEEGLRGIAQLAYHYYRRPDLWWVIAVVNDITNATRDFVAGVTLRIPSMQTVMTRLL